MDCLGEWGQGARWWGGCNHWAVVGKGRPSRSGVSQSKEPGSIVLVLGRQRWRRCRRQDHRCPTVLLELIYKTLKGFSGGSAGKESACNAGDSVLAPVLGRSPGEGNGYSLQYSCLENSTNTGAW